MLKKSYESALCAQNFIIPNLVFANACNDISTFAGINFLQTVSEIVVNKAD